MVVAILFQLFHEFGRDSVNAHRDERIFVGLVAELMKKSHHFGRYAVDAKGDQLVGVGGGRVRLCEGTRRNRD